MPKMYTAAPLPFVGQKRNFLKHYIQILNDNIKGKGQGWTIVDAFGGSGLLAHVAKHTKPDARVIYNDFDNYAQRLQHIPDTNKLRHLLLDAVGHLKKNERIQGSDKEKVIAIIDEFDGYIDVVTLASWLLFSGRQAADIEQVKLGTMYNCIRRSDCKLTDDYFNGFEIVSKSYDILLDEIACDSKTLLVLDPPYICTEQGMYANKKYFGMVEFLKLMNRVNPPFIFFSSTRSELLDYLDMLLDEKLYNWSSFDGYKRTSITSIINHNSRYEDNIIYKF